MYKGIPILPVNPSAKSLQDTRNWIFCNGTDRRTEKRDIASCRLGPWGRSSENLPRRFNFSKKRFYFTHWLYPIYESERAPRMAILVTWVYLEEVPQLAGLLPWHGSLGTSVSVFLASFTAQLPPPHFQSSSENRLSYCLHLATSSVHYKLIMFMECRLISP